MYPYRQNDLIAQCHMGDEKVTEFTKRHRKVSSSPKFLGRSNSQSNKDHGHTSHKRRISRYKSDLVNNSRDLNNVSNLFVPEGSLRLRSSAREIQQLREEDRFSNNEKGTTGSVRSDDIANKKSFSSSMEDILKEAPG